MPVFAEEVEEVLLEDEVVLSEGSELNEKAEKSPFDPNQAPGFIYSQKHQLIFVNQLWNLCWIQKKRTPWGQQPHQFDTYYTDLLKMMKDGTNRYTINYGISYDLNKVTYLVATTRFERPLWYYRKQFITATGLGRHFYDTERIKLQGSAGRVTESVNANPPMKSFEQRELRTDRQRQC